MSWEDVGVNEHLESQNELWCVVYGSHTHALYFFNNLPDTREAVLQHALDASK